MARPRRRPQNAARLVSFRSKRVMGRLASAPTFERSGIRESQRINCCQCVYDFIGFHHDRAGVSWRPMTRRSQLDLAYRLWLQELGGNLARVRVQRAWTQAQAADKCGVDIKQYQDFEHGCRALTTRTLFGLASAFGVQVTDLLINKGQVPGDPALADPLSELSAAGWQATPAIGRRKPARSLPIFDLRTCTASPGASDAPVVSAWAAPPPGQSASDGQFLTQMGGPSREPRIANGAWCLFRQPVAPPLLGKIVLLRNPVDADDGGQWLCRKVGGMSLQSPGLEVRLDSLNPDYSPQTVVVSDERDLSYAPHLIRTCTAFLTRSATGENQAGTPVRARRIARVFDPIRTELVSVLGEWLRVVAVAVGTPSTRT